MYKIKKQGGALLFGLLLLLSGCNQFSWIESYRYNKKQPYDLYALYELLSARPQGLQLHKDTLGSLLKDSLRDANFIYVGSSIYLDEEDVTALLKFVNYGNSAFLCVKAIPEDLLYHLFGPECFYLMDQAYFSGIEETYQDTVRFLLDYPGLLPDTGFLANFKYRFKTTTHNWTYVDSAMVCDRHYGLAMLGGIENVGANLLQLSWGEGYLYVLTSPELLTNYYLSDSSRHQYAAAVLHYLADGPVFWNEYGRSRKPPPAEGTKRPGYEPGSGRRLLSDNHALGYILEQPALGLAWYLFVGATILYILFRAKRRQRIIPVIQRPKNETLAHVDTVASLAIHRGNHLKLARQELRSLRHHLLERYQVRWLEGQDPPAELAQRSGLSQLNVNKAAVKANDIEKANFLSEEELRDFYRVIQVLYQTPSKP